MPQNMSFLLHTLHLNKERRQMNKEGDYMDESKETRQTWPCDDSAKEDVKHLHNRNLFSECNGYKESVESEELSILWQVS